MLRPMLVHSRRGMTMTNERYEQAIERLERRVETAIRQCERFDRLVDEVKEWSRFWTTTAIRRWMESEERTDAERERALVALAIDPSEQAGHILEEYEPPEGDDDHRAFHRVARLEWERRALPWEDPYDQIAG